MIGGEAQFRQLGKFDEAGHCCVVAPPIFPDRSSVRPHEATLSRGQRNPGVESSRREGGGKGGGSERGGPRRGVHPFVESAREPRWSWRMTKDTEAEWHRRFQRSIRSQDKMILKQSVYSLKRVPAFAESRRQVFAIMRKAKNEWIRTRKGPWPYEDFKQGWIGRYKPFRITEVKRNSIKSS